MVRPGHESDESEPMGAGTSEGDGDFDSTLPEASETSEPSVDGLKKPSDHVPGEDRVEHHKPALLERVIDEISTGKIQP